MALISICTNLILIPKFGCIGASVALVIAEIIGTVCGVYYAKGKICEIQINYLNKSLFKYILSASIMGTIIMAFQAMGYGHAVNTVFGVFIGSIIYFGILYFIKDDTCRRFITYFINKIKNLKVAV